MERVIRSGRVEERYRYRVSRTPCRKSMRRKGGTLPRKQDENERNATKRLARLINCNFDAGDLLLGLSYDDEHLKPMLTAAAGDIDKLNELANDELRKFLRRIKRELAKQGVELKAIPMTADMDGRTGELVRAHHHIVIKGEGFVWTDKKTFVGDRALEEIWGKGSVHIEPLWNQDDYTPLAAYLMRQVRRIPDKKKYSPTRNLKKPVLISEEVVYEDEKEIQPPKGARLVYRAEHIVGEGQYIRYVRTIKASKRGGSKRNKDGSQ